MSKFDEVMARCEEQLKASGAKATVEQLHAIGKGLGPSIYNRDSLLIAASDQSEIDRIQKNFIEGKLGVTDAAAGKAAIEFAVDKIGKSNRNKLRPVFYALVAENLGKLSQYG